MGSELVLYGVEPCLTDPPPSENTGVDVRFFRGLDLGLHKVLRSTSLLDASCHACNRLTFIVSCPTALGPCRRSQGLTAGREPPTAGSGCSAQSRRGPKPSSTTRPSTGSARAARCAVHQDPVTRLHRGPSSVGTVNVKRELCGDAQDNTQRAMDNVKSQPLIRLSRPHPICSALSVCW